jgi:Tol biopolymer transport system component
MTRTNQFKFFAVMAATALALCLLSLVAVQPAEAAFPGKNGMISFQSFREASGEIYTIRASGGEATRITFPTGGNVEAVYSPDGSRIAFNRGGDIHVMKSAGMKPNGTGSRRLTSMTGTESDPTWSPDGTRIAFLANTAGQDEQTDAEIWVMNADGSGQRPITHNDSSERDPAWSPKGDKIAFVDERGDSPFFDTDSNVYVMDANGNNQTNITPNVCSGGSCDYQGYDENPAWSPDGTKIAYEHGYGRTGGGSRDIWIMDPTDPSDDDNYSVSDDVTTGDDGSSEGEPAWSPLGDKIAYMLVRAGDTNQDIAVMNGDDRRKDHNPYWQPIPICTKSVNANNDPLIGTAGKDVLCGDNRSNTMNGAGGNDIILANGGNDKLTGALGNDTINGGPGKDTVLYSGSVAVRASLTTEFATGVGSDVLLAVENLSGSNANDRLTGSAVANVLVGGKGADVLSGLGGADTLRSRDGINGNDTLNGGPGTDTCIKDATEKAITSCP